MAERVLLESADGLTKEFDTEYPVWTIVTSFLGKIPPDDSAGVYHLRRYQYLEKRDGMKVYREVIE